MNEFDVIVDDCLRRMAAGQSMEECLSLYREHACELRPLLDTAGRFSIAMSVRPSMAFKGTVKARLMKRAETTRSRARGWLHPAWRLTAVISALALFALATTTAFAQNAIPGDSLYSWKLRSEEAWRAVSTDPVDVDLTLADRRATELARVAGNPAWRNQALDEFHEVLGRLSLEKNAANGPKIENALKNSHKKLQDAGIQDNQLDDLVHGKGH